MKKFYYLVLIALLGWSCQRDQEQLTPVDPVPEAEISYVAPVEEALRSLEVALDRIDGEATRVGGRRTVKSIERVKAARAMRAETRATGDQPAVEDLFYLVSFGEGQGSAVLGADRRLESIYAILDETVLTPEDFDLPATTRSEPPAEGDSIRYVSTEEELTDFVAGMIVNSIIIPGLPDFPGDGPTIPSYRPTYRTEIINEHEQFPMLLTKWHQDEPYNDMCPPLDNGLGRKYVGCAPIAVGQLLRHFQYPNPNKLDGVTYDWAYINQACYPNDPSDMTNFPRLVITQYLHKLGTFMHASYGDNGTSVSSSDMISFLRSIGLTVSAQGWSNGVAGALICNQKRPFIVSGQYNDPIKGKVGHAWIIDGWHEYERRIWRTDYVGISPQPEYIWFEESVVISHCNYGWGGLCDGYYNAGTFNVCDRRTDDQIEEEIGDDNIGTLPQYGYDLNITLYNTYE